MSNFWKRYFISIIERIKLPMQTYEKMKFQSETYENMMKCIQYEHNLEPVYACVNNGIKLMSFTKCINPVVKVRIKELINRSGIQFNFDMVDLKIIDVDDPNNQNRGGIVFGVEKDLSLTGNNYES